MARSTRGFLPSYTLPERRQARILEPICVLGLSDYKMIRSPRCTHQYKLYRKDSSSSGQPNLRQLGLLSAFTYFMA